MVKNFKGFFLRSTLITFLSLQSFQAMDSIPDDLIKLQLSHLETRDLGHCAQVSKKWSYISSSDDLWEERARIYGGAGGVFHRDYKYGLFLPSWKEILRKSYHYWDKLKEKEQEKKSINLSIISALFETNYLNPTFQSILENKRKGLNLFVIKFDPIKYEIDYSKLFNPIDLKITEIVNGTESYLVPITTQSEKVVEESKES